MDAVDPDRKLVWRAKAVMRRRARGLRASVPAEALAARSERIGAALLALPEIALAGSAALFWPIERNHEVDLRALWRALRSRGVQVAFPAIAPEDGGAMTFRWVADPAELVERGKGFSEPAAEAPIADRLDAIIVPGLLFDARGHRLGYGAGYYDRTLPRFRPPALAIGVAFDFQLAPEVPTQPADVAVDLVVTDARVLDLRGE